MIDTSPEPPVDGAPEAVPPAVRRRSDTEAAILKATRELLAEAGVLKLTVEAVAARSGVAKTTIYRRWRAKDELALAVVIDMVEQVVQTPDLGDTRAELVAFVDATVSVLHTTPMGRVMQGIASHVATDGDLSRAFSERVVKVRLAEAERLVKAGIARGDLRPDTDPQLVHELLFGAVYYRLLFGGDPLDQQLAGRIVDMTIAGIGAQT
jgi:AcrR family transcriptional regulator